MNLFVGRLTPQQKADPSVRHALDVQRALSIGNYHVLFELYDTAPNMGGYIMDHFIARERVKALMVISKACVIFLSQSRTRLTIPNYRYLTISLAHVHSEFAFQTMEETISFLTDHESAHFVDPSKPDSEKQLDCKAIFKHIPAQYEEKYRKVGIRGAI
jgi:hypothetical protein